MSCVWIAYLPFLKKFFLILGTKVVYVYKAHTLSKDSLLWGRGFQMSYELNGTNVMSEENQDLKSL